MNNDFIVMRHDALSDAPVTFRQLLAAVIEPLDQLLRVFQGKDTPFPALADDT